MTTTREEFEAWAKDRGHYLKRRADGVYMDSSACKAWDAWQAAHLAGQRAMQERAAKLLGDSAENCRKSPMPHYGIPIIFEKAKDEVLALEVKPS